MHGCTDARMHGYVYFYDNQSVTTNKNVNVLALFPFIVLLANKTYWSKACLWIDSMLNDFLPRNNGHLVSNFTSAVTA